VWVSCSVGPNRSTRFHKRWAPKVLSAFSRDWLGIAFGLASAVAFGGGAYLGALAARQFGAWITNLGEQLGVLAVLVLLAPILLGPIPPIGLVILLVGVGVVVMFSWVATYQLLTLAPVAIVWPIIASNGAIISLLAMGFLGERLRPLQLAGLGLVFIGVCATTYVRPTVAHPVPNLGVLASEPGRSQPSLIPRGATLGTLMAAIALSVVTGVGIFLVVVVVKRYGWYVPFTIERAAQSAGAICLLGVGFPPRRFLRAHPHKWWLVLLLVGVCDGLGLAMYGFGNQFGSTALTSISSSAFVVLPVVLGVILIGERPAKSQAIGIAGVIIGLVLLAG
jgi:drug/metabolite transporter (DMT)-like permease